MNIIVIKFKLHTFIIMRVTQFLSMIYLLWIRSLTDPVPHYAISVHDYLLFDGPRSPLRNFCPLLFAVDLLFDGPRFPLLLFTI